jgi:Fe-S cluster assembly protein SufB
MANKALQELAAQEYKYGFQTPIESDSIPKGLSEDVIREISRRKKEPAFMLEWRLKAYRHWLTMKEPAWANVQYPPIDYQNIIYYSAPKQAPKKLDSMEQVDPELKKTFEKLGIPLMEQKKLAGVAVDA